MKTLRLNGSNAEDVLLAASLLRDGRLVAIPTETVYGLAGDATSEAAVGGIYTAKGRPGHNPLIVHVKDGTDARHWAEWSDLAESLAQSFWPGPLTLVLPRPRGIVPTVLAGGDTVALRAPAHPIAQAVLAVCGCPLAAPSANMSNALSPTSAEAVLDTLDGRIDAVLDGGPCQVGLESTVLDLAGDRPRILRPGLLGAEALAQVLGFTPAVGTGEGSTQVLRSPGQLSRHYAPAIPLQLVDDPFRLAGPRDAVISFTHEDKQVAFAAVLPPDPKEVARLLYGTLRAAERSGATRILMTPPPSDETWAFVWDRLRRAASN
ncbi:threonylcarbamoyl-AMP synthase [bacterium]|nr:threonylcarbamoyl-AMP synthase [bacterium]